MWIDTRVGSERVAPSWQFESLLWGICSGFPLTNHFDLPCSKSVFGISQDLPMCAHTSLSQDGFYLRGIWIDNITWHHSPSDLQGAFLCMCSRGDLLTLRMRNMWSHVLPGQGPASSLNCPVILVSGYQSTGTNSNRLPPGAHLSPPSKLKAMK